MAKSSRIGDVSRSKQFLRSLRQKQTPGTKRSKNFDWGKYNDALIANKRLNNLKLHRSAFSARKVHVFNSR